MTKELEKLLDCFLKADNEGQRDVIAKVIHEIGNPRMIVKDDGSLAFLQDAIGSGGGIHSNGRVFK